MTTFLRQLLTIPVLIILGAPFSALGYGDINSLALSPDGARLAIAADGLTVVDARTLEVQWTPAEASGQVRGVAFSPNGAILATACRSGMVRLWPSAGGKALLSLKAHKKCINAIAFSPDGTQFASASSDKTVRLWDTATGREVRCLGGHGRAVHSVSFSPVGGLLGTASADGTARLWDVSAGTCTATLAGHKSSVWSIAFDPTGKFVATASRDTTVKVWDTHTGECLTTLSGHTSTVRSVVFSPDSVHLASASWDRSVRVWDLRSGKMIIAYRGHHQPVRALVFQTDGKQLISGSAYEKQLVRIWEKDLPHVSGAPEIVLKPEHLATPVCPRLPPVVILPGTEQGWRDGTHPEETATALQNALDVAAARTVHGSRVVQLPPGEYLIHSPLTMANVTLSGADATLRVENIGEKYLFGLTLGTGARLQDITILGEGGKCVPVRLGNPARDVRLRDVHIKGGTILLNGQVTCENVEIDSCLFEDGGYGLLLDRPSKGRNVRVVNCTFKNNRSDSIELNFPWHRRGNVVEDIVIANCVFEGTGADPDSGTGGFSIGIAGARGVQITGNTFRRAAVQAIHLEDHAEHITITGNNFLNCGLDHTGGNWTGGVHILSGSRYITITGNNFSNCRFGVSGLQGGTLRWCTVSGNTFRNCEIGIRIMEFPHGVIQGNLFHDCQTSINIWRTPFWNVSANQIVSARPDSIGIECTQFRNLIITGNTIQAAVPINHREKHSGLKSLVEGNLIIDAAEK